MNQPVLATLTSARLGFIAVATALVGVACSVTPADSARTVPDTTEPPVTEPATPGASTVAPTVASTVTEPPTTEAPAEVPTTAPPASDASSQPATFCGTSADFWLPSEALDYIDDTDGRAAEQLFADMTRLVDAPIAVAPDAAAAAPAEAMKVVLADLTVQLAEIDFDINRLDEASNPTALTESLVEFGGIANELEEFLQGDCGFDATELQDAAASYAAGVSTSSGGDIESIRVEDASGTVSVAVPADWTDVNPEPGEGYLSVQASANLLGFLSSFTEPGVFVEAYPSTNAATDGAAGFAAVRIRFVETGCVDGIELPYDDGVYTGFEVSLDCAPGTDLVLIGGSNADDVYFVVAMLVPDDDPGIRDLIAESFIVD